MIKLPVILLFLGLLFTSSCGNGSEKDVPENAVAIFVQNNFLDREIISVMLWDTENSRKFKQVKIAKGKSAFVGYVADARNQRRMYRLIIWDKGNEVDILDSPCSLMQNKAVTVTWNAVGEHECSVSSPYKYY